MRKILIVAAVSAAALVSTTAMAADRQRMEDLGKCLSFSFVNGGLDGMKEVPSDLLPGIMALKDEFLFEASINSLDDNAAQTYIVDQLTEQNKIKELKGIEAVRAEYLDLCTRVAESMIKSRPNVQ